MIWLMNLAKSPVLRSFPLSFLNMKLMKSKNEIKCFIQTCPDRSQVLVFPESYKELISTLRLDWTLLQGIPLSRHVPLWRRRLKEEDEGDDTCLGEVMLRDHVLLLLALLVRLKTLNVQRSAHIPFVQSLDIFWGY